MENIQSLNQENNILQATLNSLADGVIVADRQGNFVYFNPVAEEILGIGKRSIHPSKWTSVYGCFYPDEVTPYPPDQLPLARALKQGQVCSDQIFIRNEKRPDGLFINVKANPLRDSSGQLTGGIAIFQDITEKQTAEKKLLQSEESQKAQLKGFPIPTYIWQRRNGEFYLVDYNHAAESITRGKIKHFLGQSLRTMYANSSHLDELVKDFSACYDNKTNLSREMSFRLQSTGDEKDFIVRYNYITPDLVMVHTEDNTQQKRARVELQKLSNAVEQTADSVIITDRNGIIEYVNPAFEVTTGYQQAEVIGRSPGMLRSGLHDKTFYENLWKILKAGKPFRGTITNRKKDGTLYWCEQTITPMKDDGGQITDYVSVMKDITDLKKRQEQEFLLNVAQEVQQRLYCADVSVPGCDIAGAAYSAVETGGDYFDVITMPDGLYGLVVGDVSGHGVGAALIMAATRAYLRAFAKLESDPGEILTRLNSELVSDLDNTHFVTLLFARLDPAKKVLDYASAGHTPALILNRSGEVAAEMKSTGIPLGFLKDNRYEKSEIKELETGSLLVLLTDGLTEAHAVNGREFGIKRVLESIKKHRQEPAKKIIETLYQEARVFTGNAPQEDDITSIICKMD